MSSSDTDELMAPPGGGSSERPIEPGSSHGAEQGKDGMGALPAR